MGKKIEKKKVSKKEKNQQVNVPNVVLSNPHTL